MTRDRKKNMLRSLEHTVEELQHDIVTLRRHQNCNTTTSNKNEITPFASPETQPEPEPQHCQHGFSLNHNHPSSLGASTVMM